MGQQKPVILDGGTFKDLPSGEQLEVNAGTAALPAITFGDADTGLLSSGHERSRYLDKRCAARGR